MHAATALRASLVLHAVVKVAGLYQSTTEGFDAERFVFIKQGHGLTFSFSRWW